MTALEWTGWIGAALAWIMAGMFLWRAFVSRSLRRHCPKCDYIMLESSGLRCPECGHTPRNAQSFHRGRFRRRRVMIAIVLVMLGVILQAAPRVRQNGWIRSLPTTALIFHADWGNSEAAFKEIHRRAFNDALPFDERPGSWQSNVLYGWQKKLLTRSCMHALQPHQSTSLRRAALTMVSCKLTSERGDYNQLFSGFTDADSRLQKEAYFTLWDIRGYVDDSVLQGARNQLLAIIKENKQPETLYFAAMTLRDNDAIRSELYAWLEDDDPTFRMLACHFLADEDVSGAHIPVLIDLMANSPNDICSIHKRSFRKDAVGMMMHNNLVSPGVLTELMKAADHPDDELQGWIISLIGNMGPSALPALELIITKLDHPNRRVRRYAIEAIASIGEEAQSSVPDLLRLAKDEMLGLSGPALEAAMRIDPDPDRMSPLLFELHSQAAPYNLPALYRAMRWLDATDEQVAIALCNGLEDSEAGPRIAAAESLGFINPSSESIIKALVIVLDDPNESVRLASVKALAKHTEFADLSVTRLRESLANDDDNDVRTAAAMALGSIDDDPKTINVLINAIEGDGYNVRYAAIDALGEIGRKAEAAIVPLRKMLNQERPYSWLADKLNAALELIERRDSTIPDS